MDVDALLVRPMASSEDDLHSFRRCFQTNGSPRTDAGLAWQFYDPPVGRIYVDLAAIPDGSGELAGIYASFPVWMKVGDERVVAIQSIDTLTDVRFRGKGLFIRMAEALYRRCSADDVALVYGFPNGNSAHGFFTKLGWSVLDPVPYRFRPLRASYLARRLRLPSWLVRIAERIPLGRHGASLAPDERFETVTHFDSRFDEVWRAFSQHTPVAVDRSAEYLAWRLAKPGESYETVALQRGSALLGYVVIGTTSVGGVTVGKVMELIHDPASAEAGHALLREGLRRLAARGSEVAWASCFEHSPTDRCYRQSHFVMAPSGMLPVEAHMGVRALREDLAAVLKSRANWYVSYLDSDTH
jgi:hypothetical protein